jgi:patatin-related protein
MATTATDPAPTAPGDAPAFDAEQEIRFALVLYGGVSLAIYMYGVVEELQHLVRATAPARRDSVGGAPGALAFPEPESTESVYRRIARMLPAKGATPEEPVRTRFVVDIISGTSAGGINGVCLAKALANGTSLAALERLWLTEGDIGVLINDSLSAYEDGGRTPIAGLSPNARPKSLLNSDRMLLKLASAIATMDAPEADPGAIPPLVDELDLWVTATDLAGLDLPVQLSNATTSERRFASRFHFRASSREGRNDFRAEDNAFLAFAARCTSSFPFAFEPMGFRRLDDFARVPGIGAVHPEWSRFYADYAAAVPGFADRSFGDGGILDNKPFSYATDSLVGRRAQLPVERKLIYVEPDPASGHPASGPGDWNAIRTAQAAVLSIPRVEGIRGDIQDVARRNRVIERARDVIAQAATDPVEQGRVAAVADEVSPEDWAEQSLAETIASRDWGASYGTYHRLKVRGVVDYLADLIIRASGLDPDSDDLLAVHYLVRAWKDENFAEAPTEERASENRLLAEFSLPYRWRRTSFVLQRLKDLRSEDPLRVGRALTGCGLDAVALPAGPGRDAALAAFQGAVTAAQDVLHAADGALASRDGGLAERVRELRIGRRELASILADPEDASMRRAAGSLLAERGATAFAGVIDVVRGSIAKASGEARLLIDEALGPHTSRRAPEEARDPESALRYALRFYYDAFEAYDLVLYPLEYGTSIGETNAVEIVRISPRDATRPLDVPADARALQGVGIHHFGGFFHIDWRRHDMLWGRLNASECLIRALLPEGDPMLDGLIDEAHGLIIREFCADRDPPVGADDALGWFGEYRPPEAPDREATIAALDRAAVVIGTVVGDIANAGRARPIPVAPAWTALRAVMQPNPGGWRGVARVGRIALATRAGMIAAIAWTVLLGAGVAMMFVGATRSGGIVLTVVLLLATAAALVGLRLAIGALRGAIEKRVGAAVFGVADAGMPPPPGAS